MYLRLLVHGVIFWVSMLDFGGGVIWFANSFLFWLLKAGVNLFCTGLSEADWDLEHQIVFIFSGLRSSLLAINGVLQVQHCICNQQPWSMIITLRDLSWLIMIPTDLELIQGWSFNKNHWKPHNCQPTPTPTFVPTYPCVHRPTKCGFIIPRS